MSSDLDALLRRLPGCARLDPDTLALLRTAARSEHWPAGSRLVVEGEPAPDWYCIVQSGSLQVTRTGPGTEGIRDHVTAGEVFDPGIPGAPAVSSASAMEATHGLLVPQSLVVRHRGARALEGVAARRADVSLFVRRVADLLKGPPVVCTASATVVEAARLMTQRSVGSVLVIADDGGLAGIVTDRDLRSRVVAPGLPAGTPVGRVMSSPVIGIGPDALAFDALLEMMRRGVRHLAVTVEGRPLGVVSSHDLVLLQGAQPVGLARAIEAGTSIEDLASTASRVVSVVSWLAGSGVRSGEIGRLVAELNDRLVRRALALAMSLLETAGHGRPPVPFAWLAAGSEGRREQTLKTDQDNGLVYRDPPPGLEAAAAEYFERLAGAMAESLGRLGFPPCPGGFMASNAHWRQPESGWRRYFSAWMEAPQPVALLQASLFFDLRPIAGAEEVGHDLWEWVCARVPRATVFLRYMAKSALERPVPLGFFGGFVVERSGDHRDEVDLKARGVFPVTQAMRVYALSIGARETNTMDRLVAAGAREIFTPGEVGEIADAYEVVARLRLTHQLACLDAGRAPNNFIDPRTLGKADRLLLREAFRSIGWLQRHLEDRFQTSVVV
jgi:CBS domain-containing protein